LNRNHGVNQVVYTCKQQSEGRWVEDLERGVMGKINPFPWQTDTSIGDWYYNKNWKFRPVSWVIHMLIDIVSKNGNLLLNVVQRPDGSLDPEVEQMLLEMADWIKINGEGIYDTRPWEIYGEGKTKAAGGHFREDFNYSAADIRFTVKGKTLYAFALGWPQDGKVIIKSLAKTNDLNKISSIKLLGHQSKLNWKQTESGLEIITPSKLPSKYAICFKISGSNLKPVPFTIAQSVIKPDKNGTITLSAETAELFGPQIQLEAQGNEPNIGFWDNPTANASWKAEIFKTGKYKIQCSIATTHNDTALTIELQNQQIQAKPELTGNWAVFKTNDIGSVSISSPGVIVIKARPSSADTWKPINLRWIKLIPEQ
jgi:alpha-L-fucosidase